MSQKTVCSKCKKEIVFIKMPSGKFNPCDLPKVRYESLDYNPMVVSSTGKVQRLQEAGEGFISHFSTCEYAKDFRKK